MSKALATKMIAIMGDIDRLGKDARNAFHKYQYTSDNLVYDAVRKAMIQHGVAIFTKMPEVVQDHGQTSSGKKNVHTLARFEFELVDADSGESMVCIWYGEADDQNDKGVNKCATAALKYFLLKTFIIPTGDDPDGGNAPAQTQRRAQAAKPAQTSKAGADAEPPDERRKTLGERDYASNQGNTPPQDVGEWWDADRIRNMLEWANEHLWASAGMEVATGAHGYNRLAVALNLATPKGSPNALAEALTRENMNTHTASQMLEAHAAAFEANRANQPDAEDAGGGGGDA